MSELVRYSVSIEKELLEKFDREINNLGYSTRSKAVADLMRESLVRAEWKRGDEIAAAIIMVYDHHKRDLSGKLTHTQHEFPDMIISTLHIHLDHDNCLEVVIVRGSPDKVDRLAGKLKGTKGVKYCCVAPATTGARI